LRFGDTFIGVFKNEGWVEKKFGDLSEVRWEDRRDLAKEWLEILVQLFLETSNSLFIFNNIFSKTFFFYLRVLS
jgi:hypothetical protein